MRPRPQINALRSYSVVILTAEGGVVSRDAGTQRATAIDKGRSRRLDFPDAKEVRVVCSRDGVVASF